MISVVKAKQIIAADFYYKCQDLSSSFRNSFSDHLANVSPIFFLALSLVSTISRGKNLAL